MSWIYRQAEWPHTLPTSQPVCQKRTCDRKAAYLSPGQLFPINVNVFSVWSVFCWCACFEWFRMCVLIELLVGWNRQREESRWPKTRRRAQASPCRLDRSPKSPFAWTRRMLSGLLSAPRVLSPPLRLNSELLLFVCLLMHDRQIQSNPNNCLRRDALTDSTRILQSDLEQLHWRRYNNLAHAGARACQHLLVDGQRAVSFRQQINIYTFMGDTLFIWSTDWRAHFDLRRYRNPSLATSLMAFSGVMSSKLTLEPLYIPRRPSARNVFKKQSRLSGATTNSKYN